MRTYKIHEIFYSLQGEGAFSGTPMVFIRFFGCNLKCKFCDTPQSKEEMREMTVEEIFSETERLSLERVPVCLTGGEPLLQVDLDFLKAFYLRELHLETNGSLSLRSEYEDEMEHIVVSPKRGVDLDIHPSFIDELKFIYTKGEEDFILSTTALVGKKRATISPMSDGWEINWKNVQDGVNFCLRNPNFRLSLQMHKILNLK